MTLVVVPPPPLCPPPAFYPHSHPPHPSFPTIPTSCCFHSVVTWRWWRSMWGAFDIWVVVVMWHRRWVSLASSAAGDMAWLAALAWHCWLSSLALLGASDVASVGGIVGGVWGPYVASLGAGGIDGLTPDWPRSGQSPGGSMAAVLATHSGVGGGGWWWW